MQTTGMNDTTCPWVNGSSTTQGAKYIAIEHATDNGCTLPATLPIWQAGSHVCYDFEGCKPGTPPRLARSTADTLRPPLSQAPARTGLLKSPGSSSRSSKVSVRRVLALRSELYDDLIRRGCRSARADRAPCFRSGQPSTESRPTFPQGVPRITKCDLCAKNANTARAEVPHPVPSAELRSPTRRSELANLVVVPLLRWSPSRPSLFNMAVASLARTASKYGISVRAFILVCGLGHVTWKQSQGFCL